MSEKWIVTHNHSFAEFEDEMVALSYAKDHLVDRRIAAGDFGWRPDQGEVLVAKVVYESRQCDIQDATPAQRKKGFVSACDYQMFPLEEPDPDTPFLDVNRYYDSVEIPCARRVLFEEEFSRFAKAVAEKKESAAWEALLKRMPADRVSAFGVNEIRWYDEDMPCEDGFIRWRAKGPRVFGKLTLLDEEPLPGYDDE